MKEAGRGGLSGVASRQPIVLTDEIVPPPALVRAGLDALPSIIRAQGERASRRFIEFFTANIRNRNTRVAYARAVKQFFDWCDKRKLELREIEALSVAAYIEQLGAEASKPTVKQHLAAIRKLFDYLTTGGILESTRQVRCADLNTWSGAARARCSRPMRRANRWTRSRPPH
jgi:hypothetical protein